MMGSPRGNVWIYDGGTDGSTLDNSVQGSDVTFNILTSFQAPNGDASTYKRNGLIRPIQVVQGTVAVAVKAIYDYELNPQITAPAAINTAFGAKWDAGIWDSATWDTEPNATSLLFGASGIGRTIAIAMKGSSTTRLTFVGWDYSYTEGWFI